MIARNDARKANRKERPRRKRGTALYTAQFRMPEMPLFRLPDGRRRGPATGTVGRRDSDMRTLLLVILVVGALCTCCILGLAVLAAAYR